VGQVRIITTKYSGMDSGTGLGMFARRAFTASRDDGGMHAVIVTMPSMLRDQVISAPVRSEGLAIRRVEMLFRDSPGSG